MPKQNFNFTRDDIRTGFTYTFNSHHTPNRMVIVVSDPKPANWAGYLSEEEINNFNRLGIKMEYGVRCYIVDEGQYTENIGVKQILDSLFNGKIHCIQRGLNES